jgi:uncharacterized protein
MDTPEIVHAAARHRFEIHLGRTVIGTSYYRAEPGRRVFTHTEVDPDYQGHGLATQLIEHALTDTREAGLRLVAQCPTVAAYVAKHPEFDDIVDRDVTPL